MRQSTPSRSHQCSIQCHASGEGSVRGRGPSAWRTTLPLRKCQTSSNSTCFKLEPSGSAIVNDQNEEVRCLALKTYFTYELLRSSKQLSSLLPSMISLFKDKISSTLMVLGVPPLDVPTPN